MQARSDHGIGASEIAAALGLNPYHSRYALWLQKTGRAEPFSGNVATRLGQLLEPFIRQRYANQTQAELETPATSMFHPEVAWARCTPDAIVPGSHVAQYKSTGYFPGKRWTGEPPIEVQLQVQWEMFVTGLPRADVAVLIGGDELEWERYVCGQSTDLDALIAHAQFRIYTVMRDDDVIAEALDSARRFWDLVQHDTPPPIDDSEECRRHHERRAGAATGVVLPAGHAGDLIASYRDQLRAEKALKAQLEVTKNRIRALLADAQADAIDTHDGKIVWQRRAGKRETNWELVARLVASRSNMPRSEFETLVAAHTTRGEPCRAVVAPRSWGKE